MEYFHTRDKQFEDLLHVHPCYAVFLAALSQCLYPSSANFSAKLVECFKVAGDSKIVIVPLHHAFQPFTLFEYIPVAVFQQSLFYVFDFRSQLFGYRKPFQHKPTV